MVLKRLFLPFVPILILLLALTACDASAGVGDDDTFGSSSSSYSSSTSNATSSSESSSASLASSVSSSANSTGAQAYEGPGCMIGGCSGQICSDADDEPVVSTCIWTEAYACYQTARCERQGNGSCGWTQSSELRECLAKAN